MDDSAEDVFSDTISQHSFRSKGDYINLSRYTIYHSAQDLEENMAEDDNYTVKINQPLHKTTNPPQSPKVSKVEHELINQ